MFSRFLCKCFQNLCVPGLGIFPTVKPPFARAQDGGQTPTSAPGWGSQALGPVVPYVCLRARAQVQALLVAHWQEVS